MTALLLAPAMTIFAVLFVVPLTYFFVISFWRKVLFAMQPDFTFANRSAASGTERKASSDIFWAPRQ